MDGDDKSQVGNSAGKGAWLGVKLHPRAGNHAGTENLPKKRSNVAVWARRSSLDISALVPVLLKKKQTAAISRQLGGQRCLDGRETASRVGETSRDQDS